jgi:acyl-CoA synthetase (AMP-forming)/AMP-acid ligase II
MGLGWFFERLESTPEVTAFEHQGRTFTYGQLSEAIKIFGALLRQNGIRQGQKVVVLGDYTPEAFALILALAKNANIIIPLTRESVVEIGSALKVCGSDWLFEFSPQYDEPSLIRHEVKSENEMLSQFVATRSAGIVFFSSGSTGTPKAILHSIERTVDKFRTPRKPIIAIPFLMFDHFGGFNTILAIASSLGTIVTVADRSVKTICHAIEKNKVELLPATPSFLNLLMVAKAHASFDLSSLTTVTYGTEVMAQTTLDRLRTALPNVKMQQTYGLSEVGVLRTKSREHGSLWLKIGGEGFQTKVIDDVLWIKSDFAMVGYLNAPKESDSDGWFNTQDNVKVDGDYFKILGRATEVINVGGQKVYPSEVEDIIMRLTNVEDVAVSGEANAILGQIIVAKVVLKKSEETANLKSQIRIICKENLAAFKVPSRIIISKETFYSARHKKNRSN